MKIFFLILLYSTSLFCKEVQYNGTIFFRSKTNIPKVSLEASSNEFDKLQAIFTDDTNALSKIEIVLDIAKFKTGLYLDNRQIYQQNLSWLLKKDEPVYFKMKMDHIVCLKQKLTKKLFCNGNADFLAGKAGFAKPINFILDENKNTVINLILSRKKIGLPSPKKFGFEVDDKVWVYLKVLKK